MSFKHTRRTTTRAERRPDGSEVIERSEEESYEEREIPTAPAVRARMPRHRLSPSWLQRLIALAPSIALLVHRIVDLLALLILFVT